MIASAGHRALSPAAVAVLGLAALAARGVSPLSPAVVAMVGAAGLMFPVGADGLGVRADLRARRWIAATALGMAAVVAAGALAPARLLAGAWPLAAGALAAVAEEAFFRRFLYGLLERRGPAPAIAVTALAFAAVHVPLYGWAAGGVDLAAGLVFGWQRWATGGWSAPAVTHVLANLMSTGVMA